MHRQLFFIIALSFLILASCNRKPKETLAPDAGNFEDEIVLDTSAFEEIPMDNGLPQDTFPRLYKDIMVGISSASDINGYNPAFPQNKPTQADKERYSKLIRTIINRIDTLGKIQDKNRENYLTDIWFMAEYHGLVPVMDHTAKSLGRKPIPWSKSRDIMIDSLQFKNLKVLLRTGNSDSKVFSTAFEEFTLSGFDTTLRIPQAFGEFGNHLYKYKKSIKDTMVVLMPEKIGPEEIRHVFSVWKNINGKYKFISILDKYLTESQGYCSIDSIYNIGSGSYLITGKSLGGDRGDKFGSYWVGVWKKPRKFSMIYFDRWMDPGTDESCDNINYKYSFNRKSKILTLTKLTVKADCEDPRKIIQRDTLRKSIEVMKLLSKDMTKEFNNLKGF